MRWTLPSLLAAMALPAVALAQPPVPPNPYGGPVEAPLDGELTFDEAGREDAPARRPVPNLDGRDEPGMTADEALLWVPRVLFFPVHLVLEYVLRLPLSGLISFVEKNCWDLLLIDFFTWEDRKAGLVPTAFVDFGLQPAVGLYFFWNDLGTPGHQLRAQLGFGGVDWLRGAVTDRVAVAERFTLISRVDAFRRPDWLFEGLGFDSRVAERSNYTRSQVDGEVALRFDIWRGSFLRFGSGLRWADFDPTEGGAPFTNNPTLEEAVAQGFYQLPAGFEGFFAYRQRLDIVVDSRVEAPASGSGVRVETFAELGFDLSRPIDRRWARYGGTIGGFLDIGHNRVIGLSTLVHLADALGPEPVPISELATLGGETLLMDGFLLGQLLGGSATATTLEYRYPVWVWLDASLHASVGNVFDERFSDFDVERMRLSFGLGLRSRGDRDQGFSLLIAFGSRPFSEGGEITSVRLFAGATQGF